MTYWGWTEQNGDERIRLTELCPPTLCSMCLSLLLQSKKTPLSSSLCRWLARRGTLRRPRTRSASCGCRPSRARSLPACSPARASRTRWESSFIFTLSRAHRARPALPASSCRVWEVVRQVQRRVWEDLLLEVTDIRDRTRLVSAIWGDAASFSYSYFPSSASPLLTGSTVPPFV